jgi:hypothetical protein
MNKIKTLLVVLLLSLNPVFSQVVDLGSLSNFVFFTSEGAIENTGASAITGDIGSDLGLVALPGATHNGNVHSHDSVTELAKFDLITLYQKLLCVPNKDSTRAPAFGSGEILTTGAYFIDTCGSLSGNITLNGQGDTNALFIIKFGATFTVEANSTVILTNNARACNVFWITEGNCLIGSSTIMAGTVISSGGLIAMGANGDLTGRLLTMDGAIDFGPSNAQIPNCNSTIVSSCTDIPQVVNLGSLANFVFFTSSGNITNTGASVINGDIGSELGLITLPGATHIGNVYNQDAITAQAKFDLIKLYQQLICVAATDVSHTPSFGVGETLTPGVYSISAAGSLAADITLDAEGDTTALFIVKFGAAFTVAANSTVYLANGARACNVFWIAGGAAAIDEATVMVGTVISSAGALAMGASGNLTGRLFTIAGNIAFGPSNAQIPTCNSTALVVCAGVGDVPPCNFIKTKSCSLFTIYTSLGNIENSADSDIIGKVGTNSSAITGFETSTVDVGAFHIADSLTAVTKNDLSALYKQLSSLQPTNIGHAPAFGGGEAALHPGIYYTPGSGTVYGNLVLDGLGDSNSIFIFQFTGAFSAIASSSISLINGTRDCNVFWAVKGAITLGALSSMKGSFLSKNRGIIMEAGATLKGRILTGKGAISITSANSMVLPECGCHVPYPLPIDLLSFSGECLYNQIRLNWETASESNNDYFSIERSKDGINWVEIGKINAEGNSSTSSKYFLDDENQYNEISYYRIKQHDFSGVARTFSPISVQNCYFGNEVLSIFPNPAKNAININFSGDSEQVTNTKILDLFGRQIYQSSSFQSAINIENFEDGIYFLQLLLKSENITRKFLIAK